MKKIVTFFYFLIFLMLAVPVYAQDDTLFTVYGRVYDTDGVTPLNGITVTLTIGSSSTSTNTTNGTLADGTAVSGYYYFPVLPSGATTGTSMTISASTTGKSTSTTVARAATEPQEVDLTLSIGSGSTTTSSSGGGGGGGGGGGASGENYTNIQAKESREEFIAKDLPATYNFTTAGLPVYGIAITGNTNAGLIAIQIELLRNSSTLVKEAPLGAVYKNINIWVGTSGFATPKNIKEAIIKFKVEDSWITSGGFKDAEIIMVRWDGTQWVRLETQPKYKDGGFTHYEAKTNAFSPFAIVGLKGVTVPTVTVVDTGTSSKPGETAAPTPVTPRGSIVTSILVIILAAALILAIYKFKLQRR